MEAVLLHRPEDPALAAVKLLLLDHMPMLVAVDIHALGLRPAQLSDIAVRVLLRRKGLCELDSVLGGLDVAWVGPEGLEISNNVSLELGRPHDPADL